MGITYEYKDNNQVIDRSNIGVDFSMSDSEIVKSEEYLNDKDKVLEWGAGGSTLYFSNIVSSYVSIEHDKLWYDKLTSQINDNVELLYVSTHDEKFDDKLDKNAFDILRGDESWYNKDGNKEIYIADPYGYGTTVTNISNTSGDEQYPTCSPDGTKIAYAYSSFGGPTEICSEEITSKNIGYNVPIKTTIKKYIMNQLLIKIEVSLLSQKKL